MKKSKLFLIIFMLILVAVAGIFFYGLIHKNEDAEIGRNGLTSTESSVFSSELTTTSETTSEQTTTDVTTATNSTSKQIDLMPKDWNDNGIFSAYYERAYQKMSLMSLDEKVGQIILGRCVDVDAISTIRNYHLGGFVLFEDNFKGKTQASVIASIKSYQSASKIPMMMSVDEEGGTVVRISSNKLLSNKVFQSPQVVYANGGLNGVRADTLEKANMLKKLGLNDNLAPVADVSLDSSDYIYNRVLGKPAKETGYYVAAVVETMNKSGLSSTLKHFPGYGNNVNTHTGIATDNRPYSTFVNSDFIPFEYGIKAGVQSILVSHNIVNCMDKNIPASLSPAVHQILRRALHFTGIIMTDDLTMDAIKEYTQSQDPAVKAVLAGNDMLIMKEFKVGYGSVIKAVRTGVIPQKQLDKAVMRVLAWKYASGMLK